MELQDLPSQIRQSSVPIKSEQGGSDVITAATKFIGFALLSPAIDTERGGRLTTSIKRELDRVTRLARMARASHVKDVFKTPTLGAPRVNLAHLLKNVTGWRVT